jgi:hypothetical protein
MIFVNILSHIYALLNSIQLVHVDLVPLVLLLMVGMYRLHLVFIEMELAVALVTR